MNFMLRSKKIVFNHRQLKFQHKTKFEIKKAIGTVGAEQH
jgi:hypothetical protein